MSLFEKNEKRRILFQPKMYTQEKITEEKIDESIRSAMQRGKQAESFILQRNSSQTILDDWKPAPEGNEIPRAGNPYQTKTLIKQPEKQPENQCDVWTAEQWEDWAVMVYQAYPEFAKYLPQWITEMIEDIKKRK